MRGHHLVEDLVIDAARTADGIEVDVAAIRHRPFVQAFAADAEAVCSDSLGPVMNPSGEMDM